jgi:acyl carrier protein
MNKDRFLKNLERILQVDPGTIEFDSVLVELEDWDSLAVLGFIGFIDREFKKVISPKEVLKAKSIQDLYNLIDSGSSGDE